MVKFSDSASASRDKETQMSRKMVVVGAGMVGVSVAWHLSQRGHQVTLVDRREPGRETSYGNAGIIQREAVRPYAFPRDLGTLLRVAPNRQIDIRYRPGAMMANAGTLLKYWQHSAPARYERIVPEYASLISGCIDAHAAMIAASGAEELIRRDGWLEVYRSEAELTARYAQAQADAQSFGIRFKRLDRAELAQLEPGLASGAGNDSGKGLAGAIHWLDPWTVASPGDLVAAYARSFVESGGEIVQANVDAVERTGQAWRVSLGGGAVSRQLDADGLVMALGPWTQEWMTALGLRIPLFVKRGYHMHYAQPDERALGHWVMDAEVGYLLAPMRQGVRLTTGAELERLEAPAHLDQLEAAERKARELFPLGQRLESTPWKGARPCTPDMKPVIGPVPGQDGLWLACGHGHQGFTLGPVTGKLLTQLIEGEPADIDMTPFRVDRF
ncbi:FAD-binding oxidoreductase [Halomonas sp. DP8Y7-1]|uniref:NAD(P)/FAD-dependent oxidoreductase n=1 Tax=Halomonas sp. DP8Y7-1 TaxID=2859078 RepID=UPI001C963EC1|nr:FAD-dependent oxidoreductase [Halomonas sp. DP8Y7-1]MBY6030334.1 FAD-binding oxidoreductase [Halomonas sp. DP8Y7-1]